MEVFSEAEAVRNLRLLSQREIAQDAEIIEVPILKTVHDNPWLELAGALRDDPTFDDWQNEIAKYREVKDREDS